MEEIKNIIAEMRDRSDTVVGGRTITLRNFVSQEQCEEWADRIEQTVTNCHAFKMRKALELAVRLLKDATESDEYGDDAIYLVGCMRTVMQACSTALKEPVRNCDLYASVDDAWTAFCKDDPPHLMYSPWLDSLVKFRDWPKRNCDVGTTKEQIKRFHKFCLAHNDCYKCDCPVDSDDGGCMIRWAQMPYEKGDNNDK